MTGNEWDDYLLNMVKISPAYDKIEKVQELFKEYTSFLISTDSVFSAYLELQNYDEEEKDPAKKYAPPHGRLFLAYLDDEAVGVIALRMIDKDKCELKRLYVKKEARGKGIARMLVEKLIAEAKTIGYKTMYLDSLPQLEDAIVLYRKIGFSDTERYNRSPCENTIFMKLDLT